MKNNEVSNIISLLALTLALMIIMFGTIFLISAQDEASKYKEHYNIMCNYARSLEKRLPIQKYNPTEKGWRYEE